MSYRETAEVLAAQARAALDPDKTTVTLDLAEGVAALAAAQDVVLIRPPSIERDTHYHATATWTVLVAPGTAQDGLAAWDQIDELLAPLMAALDIDTARPFDWRPDDGPLLPAYELTTTTDHDND